MTLSIFTVQPMYFDSCTFLGVGLKSNNGFEVKVVTFRFRKHKLYKKL